MAYHLHLTKRILTIIRNRIGKEPSCRVCGRVFVVDNEILSIPKKNSPIDREYSCYECYIKKLNKKEAKKIG